MANEITLSTRLKRVKNGRTAERGTLGLSVDASGDQYQGGIQTIGTSEEALILGDVAAGGYCWIKNLDSTNFVSFRSGTGATDFMELLPGEEACFRLSRSATAPYAIADTAAVDIEVLLFDA